MMTAALVRTSEWALPAAVALGGAVLGYMVRGALFPWLQRAAARTRWRYDDVLIKAIRKPLVLWFTLAGVAAAEKILSLPPELHGPLSRVLLVLGILSVTWALASFAYGAVRTGAAAGAVPGVSLLANVARLTVYAVGALIVLQSVGISITPIVTALGVGGLAVGLALQDTLANLFAGIRIVAAGKLRPGDFVQLETGQEGVIEDISWGQTTIRQPGNNLVIVPNAKLATAITTNFALPSSPQNWVVNVGVAYGSDLAQVERVALDVARQTLREVPEGVAAFEPVLFFRELGSSSVNFFVVLQARSYGERLRLASEYIKRLLPRFSSEGIEIPFPVRTVHIRQPLGEEERGER